MMVRMMTEARMRKDEIFLGATMINDQEYNDGDVDDDDAAKSLDEEELHRWWKARRMKWQLWQ